MPTKEDCHTQHGQVNIFPTTSHKYECVRLLTYQLKLFASRFYALSGIARPAIVPWTRLLISARGSSESPIHTFLLHRPYMLHITRLLRNYYYIFICSHRSSSSGAGMRANTHFSIRSFWSGPDMRLPSSRFSPCFLALKLN